MRSQVRNPPFLFYSPHRSFTIYLVYVRTFLFYEHPPALRSSLMQYYMMITGILFSSIWTLTQLCIY